MWWYRALHARLVHALRPTTGRILDAGCGTGGFLAALATARPDLTCIGLEWNPTAALRAAAKSGAAIARGQRQHTPIRRRCVRRRGLRRRSVPRRGGPAGSPPGAPPCPASRRPPDPQPAGLSVAAVRPRPPGPQCPPLHCPYHRRPAAPGRLPARPRRLLEQPPAPADDRPSASCSPVAIPCPTSPRFRHGSMPHCTPPRILNATSPSPFPSAARCWQ